MARIKTLSANSTINEHADHDDNSHGHLDVTDDTFDDEEEQDDNADSFVNRKRIKLQT